jgi:hypothetical protein
MNMACRAATSPAANGNGGMVPPRHLPPTAMAAWCHRRATSPAGNGNGGRGLLTKNFVGGLF